jgi:hypothetical protein
MKILDATQIDEELPAVLLETRAKSFSISAGREIPCLNGPPGFIATIIKLGSWTSHPVDCTQSSHLQWTYLKSVVAAFTSAEISVNA